MSSKWTSPANEATCLYLVGAPSLCDRVFHPAFTYPIFGDAETIYGYERLHIQLSFASGSLRPSLNIEYRAKNTMTTAKVDDVDEQLREFLPEADLVSPDAFPQLVQADAASFQPPGTQITSYTQRSKGQTTDRTFCIFHSTWDTPGFRAWLKRAQIFTLFFIEGASYLEEEEKNWEFFTIFERTNAPSTQQQSDQHHATWHFVGYTALYRFWCWPGKTRWRLSQFLILPPYQGQRHGTHLYQTVYEHALSDPAICELTIEDPSEAFDKLRDTCDLTYLNQQNDVVHHIAAPIDRAWRSSARLRYKIAPRQWARLLDMLGLLHLDPDASPDQFRAFRLQVKARIYQQNREVLDMLPHEQRVEKLHETFEAVLDEYADITGVEVPEALLEMSPSPQLKRMPSSLNDDDHNEGSSVPRKMPRLV